MSVKVSATGHSRYRLANAGAAVHMRFPTRTFHRGSVEILYDGRVPIGKNHSRFIGCFELWCATEELGELLRDESKSW